jgi:hypothetical protein
VQQHTRWGSPLAASAAWMAAGAENAVERRGDRIGTQTLDEKFFPKQYIVRGRRYQQTTSPNDRLVFPTKRNQNVQPRRQRASNSYEVRKNLYDTRMIENAPIPGSLKLLEDSGNRSRSYNKANNFSTNVLPPFGNIRCFSFVK